MKIREQRGGVLIRLIKRDENGETDMLAGLDPRDGQVIVSLEQQSTERSGEKKSKDHAVTALTFSLCTIESFELTGLTS